MTESANGVGLSSLFTADDVICCSQQKDHRSVVSEILMNLARRHTIGPLDATIAAVLEREEKLSTVVATGIALPHARVDTVDRVTIGVATSRDGITFQSDSGPAVVHLVVLILVPLDQPGAYLQVLSSIAKIASTDRVSAQIAELTTAEEVWRFFDSGGMVLPGFVCAGHIMNSSFPTLKDTDTLQHAIDTFVELNVAELAVVDKAGSFVGIVSEDELLKKCLPDYILWTEDLSPVIDFQPFTDMLRNESRTWLSDIMSTDVVTLPENAPAVQVAKEMSARNVRQVFVVRDGKLVGIINIQDFINKVLRY